MIYRAIGLMSGSSLDGIDLVFAEFQVDKTTWQFQIQASACYPYSQDWLDQLKNAVRLSALDYQLLHTAYGHYLGQSINRFIEENNLHYKTGLIGSHGHTIFHLPAQKMTAQLGDGAAIAAETGLPVVSDLRALDVAFGGEGAPIVPIGEKLLFPAFSLFLNLGGIANISFNQPGSYIAFDVCPANRVLNLLAEKEGKEYDEDGNMARSGKIHEDLLQELNRLDYYKKAYPKSLANSFGTEVIFPLIQQRQISTADALHTYTLHIAEQISDCIQKAGIHHQQLLVTGGGAFNRFLIEKLQEKLHHSQIEIIIPHADIVQYKEALIMAFIAVLRWRQEYNVLASVTGASRPSIGGALWIGQEA